ncbi:MAG TPA: thioredoxin family protein [Ferruginibacter sp.]|jgi:thioredoxin-related protein|nr:thioredoxin family protein [Ferruginibacter sp.]
MNKKILFTGVLITLAVLVFACLPKTEKENKVATGTAVTEETGIKFIEENWTKALTEAKKQNKLVFLDAYTSWCGPCKMLKRNTFPDKAAGEFFNKNFINVAVDMEKGEGLAVAAQYQVRAYPTLIIADANGKVVSVTEGYVDASQLIQFGKYGLSLKGK